MTSHRRSTDGSMRSPGEAKRNPGTTIRLRASVRREAIQQSIAASALQVGLRAAAVRTARGVRGVPGLRGVIVAQPDAVGMTDHRRALRRARPVLAGAILAGRKRRPVRL